MGLEDLINISKKHKKIILFDFFDLNQMKEINSFTNSVSGKDLIHINKNKSKEAVQWSVNSLSFQTDLPSSISHIQIYWSSTDIGLVFSGKISKAPLDFVLCYCYTIALKTPKSREKNEVRHYFDYCGIITTEYKWTT